MGLRILRRALYHRRTREPPLPIRSPAVESGAELQRGYARLAAASSPAKRSCRVLALQRRPEAVLLDSGVRTLSAMVWTGLAMSPAMWRSIRFGSNVRRTSVGAHAAFHGGQSAALVPGRARDDARSRRIRRARASDGHGLSTVERGRDMKRIARRTFLRAGISSIAGVAGIGGAIFAARRGGLVPPDHGGLFGIGETLTYGAQRLLVSGQTLAREFDRSHISTVAEINGYPPENDRYLRLLANDFDDWRLTVDGLVARPRRSRYSSACQAAVDHLASARKAGGSSPSGRASLFRTCSISSGLVRRRGTWSSCRTTIGGAVSTWSTRCTIRPYWRTA